MKKYSFLLLAIASIVGPISGHAQNLTWTTDTAVSNVTDVYTGDGRPTATSAFLGNQIWVAYTSTTCSSGCAIKITSAPAYFLPGPGTLSFSTPIYVSVPGVGNITSNHSPALTAANGYLYLAYNDASNNNWLIRSSNGVDWSTRYQVAPGYSTTWAPAIAAGNTTYPNKLFVGFASASTFTPIICDVNANLTSFPSSTQNCASFPTLNQMNFNPALLAYNSGALMAYEYRGNAHCVYTYFLDPDANSYSIYQDGFANCPEQTSTAPSLAQYSENDRILLGFGSNDSSRHFDVRFTDQLSTYFNYRQSLPQEINGSPNLLVVHPTNYNPEFANFYIWNGQLRYMFGH